MASARIARLTAGPPRYAGGGGHIRNTPPSHLQPFRSNPPHSQIRCPSFAFRTPKDIPVHEKVKHLCAFALEGRAFRLDPPLEFRKTPPEEFRLRSM
jgi:hypothetical protein